MTATSLRLTRYIPHEPHAPQIAFLCLDELEAFYGGAAGGGKSDALLMAALQYVDQPDYGALILRRTYAQLAENDAIMERSHKWLRNTAASWSGERYRWTFPSGATLTFGHCKDEDSKYNYQGGAWHFIGFDELTQFAESQYEFIAFSRGRTLTDSKIPLRIRSTGNPGGIGHGWVKRRFIDPATRTGIFIPAKLDDNPSLNRAQYVESLNHLGEILRAQLLDGDWGAFEGMAYSHFDRSVHVVDAFELPESFDRFEGMDHGVDHPTAWLLVAMDYDGNAIVCDEYSSPGLPDQHAAEVKSRRADWWEARDQDGWHQRHVCYGDPQSIAERTHERDEFGDPMTIQDIYQRLGIRIVPANNRRRVGYVTVAEMLKPQPARRFPMWHPNAGENGSPRLFIVGRRCPNLVDELLTAPLASGENDPEQGTAVDKKWEGANGHEHAALRYALVTRFQGRPSEEPKPVPSDPRAAFLARRQERSRPKGTRKRDVFVDL